MGSSATMNERIVHDDQMAPRNMVKPLGAFLRAVWAILWKDIMVEIHSRELLSAMLVFAFLVILIFNFALELDTKVRSNVTSGILWVTFTFAGILGLNRSMATEKDRGCLDGLMLSPVDRGVIYVGKTLGNLVFMLVVEAIVLPVFSVLYNINLFQPGLVLVILLGSEGYVAAGTLLSGMAVQTRTRDIMLPILLFPIIIPLLIAAVKASNGFLAGSMVPQGIQMEEIWPWLNLLLAYDVIFTTVSYLVFEYVLED